MTKELLKEIFEKADSDWKGDNAIQGLKIIGKYFDPEKEDIICGADHDVIWSVDIDEIIERGLTREDAESLAKLNWTLGEDGDCLSCFV